MSRDCCPITETKYGPVVTMCADHEDFFMGSTDPTLCDCGHEGGARCWHLAPCPLA